MNYKPGRMSAGDYETLYTRDPGYFIEHLITNLIYAKGAVEVEKHKQIFLKWIGFYSNSLKEEVMSEITMQHADKVAELLTEAERRGRLLALTNLPFKASLLSPDRVDMAKVNEFIKQLKAIEPIGVTKGDNQ